MQHEDTIFALASGPGKGGIAVIRISGSGSRQVLKNLCAGNMPKPRCAALRTLRGPNKKVLDQALVLFFPAPGSFTGDDVAELHVHGGTAIVEAVSQTLLDMGLRQASPGEFSRRAFENGKMDLTEAEGLADLIDAQTEGQRRQALLQMQGGLRELYEDWRVRIIEALAQIEGEIDFPDEEDVPDRLAEKARPILTTLIRDIEDILASGRRGERVRHGIDIAVIGAPNAGKSSLINVLAKRDAAIVSREAGTTRDVIEINMELAGLPVRLSDTAGLREAQSDIEAEGVRRARLRAEQADLRLLVIDSTGRAPDTLLHNLQPGDFIVYNKTDLPHQTPENVSRETFFISIKTDQGLEKLEKALENEVMQRFGGPEQAGLTRARHRQSVETLLTALQAAEKSLCKAPELTGADLHLALQAIRELAGETDIESVLDRVFSSFCIGK